MISNVSAHEYEWHYNIDFCQLFVDLIWNLCICDTDKMYVLKLTATAITCIPNYKNLNNREKFNEILTNRESEMISALGSYLTLAFQKRYQILSIPNN